MNLEELLQQIDEKFGPKFDELTQKAADLGERLQAAESEEDKQELTQKIESLDETVKELTAERQKALREVEFKSMASRVESLEDALKQAREESGDFSLGGEVTEEQKALYGPNGEHSFIHDVIAASKGDRDARDRWTEAVGEKAMGATRGSTGGFLVPEIVSNQIIELREHRNVLRPLFSRLSVSSDTLRIPAITGGLVAGWVAEFAEKPESELTFGELSVNVFQKAGLAVASNQLLADASQSVERLVFTDLAKRLAALEEQAFLYGTGNGQPLGLLNTDGVGDAGGPLTDSGVLPLLDKIVQAIVNVYTNYLGAPNAIVMHPRDWARIVSAREEETSAAYLVGPPAGASSRKPTDRLPGFGSGQVPLGALFGVPVYTTANVPVTLGDDENETAVIVGNFNEGLILDRSGITMDSSEHVYFTSNQTVFRAEDRVGFTAARYPEAFEIIRGEGLAV